MMKKFLLLIILSVFASGATAQEIFKNAPKLFPVKRSEKIGYIDNTGKVVIEPQFENGSTFTEGLAKVFNDGGWKYIDETGAIVIKLSYYSPWFSEGLAVIDGGIEKKGYIDRQGKVVIEPQFEEAGFFFEGLAAVKKDGKYFYIDKSGKKAFKETGCLLPQGFSEGLAAFACGKNRGFIDKTGKFVINDEDLIDVNPFSEGYSRVLSKRNYRYGYIDKSGRFVIAPQFEAADTFIDGLAGAKLKGKYGFIDKTGKMVIQPRFDEVGAFFEDVSWVDINGKKGFIDKSGEIIIPNIFDGAASFSGGLAMVRIDRDYFYINKRGLIISDACGSC